MPNAPLPERPNMPISKKRTAPDLSDYMEDPEDLDLAEEEDDEEEAPKPKKKAKKAKKDKEKKKPKKVVVEDDDDDDDDDEEEEDPDDLPARSSVVQKGWGEARKRINESFTDEFKFSEDEQVVKFIDGEPAIYRQHWFNDKPGKKSYVCLEDGCPLCDELGDNPSNRFVFSVVNLSMEDHPVQALVAGIRLANVLQKEHVSERRGPLERHYWSLSKTGEKLSTVHKAEMVKERDLAEDFGIDPDEVAQSLKDRKPIPVSKIVQVSSLKDLQEVADELS